MEEDRKDGVDSPVWDGEEAGAAGETEASVHDRSAARGISESPTPPRGGIAAEEDEPMPPRGGAIAEATAPPQSSPPRFSPPPPPLPPVKAELTELSARRCAATDDDSDAPTPPRRRSPGAPRGISESPTRSPRRASPSQSGGNGSRRPEGGTGADYRPVLKAVGYVKNFQEEKGFGFIQEEGKDDQYFVHFSGIAGRGFKKLEKGQQVLFDTEWNEQKQKPQAVNVRLLYEGNDRGHNRLRETGKGGNGKRQRSRSPRGKDKGNQDEDPIYDAVNDSLTWLFRELLEVDTTLHKKVVGYLRQAVKRTSFEGNILDIFQNFADNFFSSLFSAYGDRPWLREIKVDFAWVFEVAALELFPEDLVAKFSQSKGQLQFLLGKAHDIKYDSNRFFHFLHDAVKGGHIEGKKTQNKVSEAVTNGREASIKKIKQSLGIDIWNDREERSFSLRDLEFFIKAWMEATISEVRTKGNHEGCGLEGILTRANAMEVFDSLLRDKAFPQIMIRSLKHEWPSSPWSFLQDLISQAYGSSSSFVTTVKRKQNAVMDSLGMQENPNEKYNAAIQRQRGYGRRHREQPTRSRAYGVPLPPPPPAQRHQSSSSRPLVQHFGTEDTEMVRPPPLAAIDDYYSRAGEVPQRPGKAMPPRPGYAQGYQERLPGRSQVKQEVDEQARRGKGEEFSHYPQKVLSRRPPSSDSEDDYGRQDWKGKGKMNGKGKTGLTRNPQGRMVVTKFEVKEEYQEEYHPRKW